MWMKKMKKKTFISKCSGQKQPGAGMPRCFYSVSNRPWCCKYLVHPSSSDTGHQLKLLPVTL